MTKHISGIFHNTRITSAWKIIAIIMGIILFYTYLFFFFFDIESGQYTTVLETPKKEDFAKPPNFYTPHLVVAAILFVASLTGYLVVKTNKTKVSLRKEKDGTYLDIQGLAFKAENMRIHKYFGYIFRHSHSFSPKTMLVLEFTTTKGKYMICGNIDNYEILNLKVMDKGILNKQLLSFKKDTVLDMARFLELIDASQS